MDSLKDLAKKAKEIVNHPRNQNLKEMWQRHDKLQIVEQIPFCMDMRDSMWGRFLGYDLNELTPEKIPELIRFQLEQKVFYHDRICDDTIIHPHLHTSSYAVPTVSLTMFGAKRTNIPRTEGWSVEPIINTEADLKKLENLRIPHDPSSARSRADRYSDLIDGELPISPTGISGFNRGPMDTAVQLRGWQSLMFDMIDRPAFVHDLMEAITRCRLDYETRRAEMLNIDLKKSGGGLWEDDVNCDVLSPELYEEFIFPYEKRMADQYQTVTYHSCGNLTPVLPLIDSLPNLHKLYFSEPWTDFESARMVVDNRKIIRVDLNPPTNIGASAETVGESLAGFAANAKCAVAEFHMASARTGSVDEVLAWIELGKKTMHAARRFDTGNEVSR